MTLRDISIALAPATAPWPGDTPFSCGWTWEISAGASVNVSAFTTSPHVGTHADAPLHVSANAMAADAMPLAAFAGPARVLTVDGAKAELGASDFAALGGARVERLLLRTGRSIADGAFPAAWPACSLDAVRSLLDRGLRLLGVDAPSVDERESNSLLQMLYDHINTPEFHVRVRWRLGTIAVWEERITQHRGVADFTGPRKLRRLTFKGDCPSR